ncbi:MAG TPA: oxygen-independent coproporphyrinogen III oxidase-like protein, partial [Woeseiaceae bacterium]|nr:oxygen-independent coproporphyrinogen III oxidase-like protein [Woeseiaceae bacterium]
QQAEKRKFASGASPVPDADLGFEYLLNVLRLPQGFSETGLRQRTGLCLDALRPQLERAAGKGLIASQDGVDWKPTALGWRFLNDLQAEFLPA